MTTASPWKTVTIAPFIDLISGFAFPSDRFTGEEGMPLIRIRDLDRQETVINFRGRYDNCYLVKRGDLLIGMDGDFLTVKWKGSNALLNQRVCKLVTKDAKLLNQDFLFYRIIDEIVRINRITSATTVKHLSSRDVLGIKISLPPKPEQTKIAEILSTVDRAIEQTEVLIAKQQRIKTGLMQDLLTRGIDEHGNLRSEQTHEFKDSPLGRIPVEWEIVPLADLTSAPESITYGVLKPGPYVDGGVPLLQIEDVIHGELDLVSVHRISAELDTQYKRTRLQGGEIVVSLVGTIGKIAHLPRSIAGGNLHRNLGLIRIVEPHSSRFVFHYLKSEFGQQEFVQESLGSTQALFNLSALRSLRVLKPPIDEQTRIAKLCDVLDITMVSTTVSRQKLRSLKTALMQDLLTGKKRVLSILEPESPIS